MVYRKALSQVCMLWRGSIFAGLYLVNNKRLKLPLEKSDVGGAPLRLVVGLGQVRPRHPAVDGLQVLDVGQDLVQLPCTIYSGQGHPCHVPYRLVGEVIQSWRRPLLLHSVL